MYVNEQLFEYIINLAFVLNSLCQVNYLLVIQGYVQNPIKALSASKVK